MRVFLLKGTDNLYSCNSYLILGKWNKIDDVNSLVDVGTDGSIAMAIDRMSTGFGKRPIEQVFLTHSHFDHIGGLSVIREKFQPVVYCMTKVEGVDVILKDRQMVKLGDRFFEIIHTPGHSNDSICLYCEEEKVLFSGDTPIKILTPGGSYSYQFLSSLERIARRQIEVIYPGHDNPIRHNVRSLLLMTLRNVKQSTIVYTNSEERRIV